MANYTVSIREILQLHKSANQNLMNVNDVLDLSKDYLFDEAPLNVLSNEYIDNFVLGFTLHFFNEELGLETIPLWKIALNEKLINNSSYINQIFDMLDKQLFTSYKVRRVENTANNEKSTEKHDDITLTKLNNSTDTLSEAVTSSDERTTENSETKTGTGTVENAKTGYDELNKTGTVADAKSGTDALERTGTDVKAKSGQDVVDHNGSITDEHTGTQTLDKDNDQTTTNTGTTTNDINSVVVQFDTPQGALSNMRTPGGDATGQGVAYANGQTYNYMSAASETDQTNQQTDNTTQHVIDDGSDVTTFDDTQHRILETSDVTEYDSSETETKNLTDTTRYNSTNTQTNNTKDKTDYHSTDTETRNTSDSVSAEISESGEKTESKTSTNQNYANGTDTTVGAQTVTENGESTDTTEETNSELNWEMVYKSMPLLNKVWEVFDDLFFILL